ncbi:hypothetical protein AC529_11815 [Thermobifida cellulosilytica TB100]|uniref:Uncharacterized protein n=1 Tax=Thermobifida cellulosilytica TB100 TaxID=665004 RepID=A0A147KGN2_THECS|nr:hypothetical protein AC529_11815 [Thermobifida cellulosilytica TB100]
MLRCCAGSRRSGAWAREFGEKTVRSFGRERRRVSLEESEWGQGWDGVAEEDRELVVTISEMPFFIRLVMYYSDSHVWMVRFTGFGHLWPW